MNIQKALCEWWRTLCRSINGPVANAGERSLGTLLWIAGVGCIGYWLHIFQLWQRPGTAIAGWIKGNSAVGANQEPDMWLVGLLSALAFGALIGVCALLYWTNESLQKLLQRQGHRIKVVVHWLFTFVVVASCAYLAWRLLCALFAWVGESTLMSQIVLLVAIGVALTIPIYFVIRYWSGKRNEGNLAGPFQPTLASSAAALFVALWFSYFCIYPVLIDYAYRTLVDGYKQTNVFVDTLRADPYVQDNSAGSADDVRFPQFMKFEKVTDEEAGIAESPHGIYEAQENDLELLYKYLIYVGIVPQTMSLQDFKANEQLRNDIPFLFQRHLVANDQFEEGDFVLLGKVLLDENFSSLSFARSLAQKMEGDTEHDATTTTSSGKSGDTSEGTKSDPIVNALAVSLAGAPTTSDVWDTEETKGSAWERFSGIFALRPTSIPQGLSDTEVLAHLIHKLRFRGPRKKSSEALPLDEIVTKIKRAHEKVELKKAAATATDAAAPPPADGTTQTPATPGASEAISPETALANARREYAAWNFFGPEENKQKAKQMLAETIARTHSSPQVKYGRYLVSIVQGQEQLWMLVLAVWLTLLLAIRAWKARWLNRSAAWTSAVTKHIAGEANTEPAQRLAAKLFGLESLANDDHVEEAVENRFARIRRVNNDGRWLMRWIAQALPAIGFIGTVRGISAGLGSADAIVRAENMISQAAAINQVAGQLGIAFTTTLIALLFGLALGLLERLQASEENSMLSALETACVAGHLRRSAA